jgi:hypothetical protein
LSKCILKDISEVIKGNFFSETDTKLFLVEMKSNKSDRIILKLPREQALTFSLV